MKKIIKICSKLEINDLIQMSINRPEIYEFIIHNYISIYNPEIHQYTTPLTFLAILISTVEINSSPKYHLLSSETRNLIWNAFMNIGNDNDNDDRSLVSWKSWKDSNLIIFMRDRYVIDGKFLTCWQNWYKLISEFPHLIYQLPSQYLLYPMFALAIRNDPSIGMEILSYPVDVLYYNIPTANPSICKWSQDLNGPFTYICYIMTLTIIVQPQLTHEINKICKEKIQ